MLREIVRRLRRRLAELRTPERGYAPSEEGIKFVDMINDSDLRQLNQTLPWMAFTIDKRGRRFGGVAWGGKRTAPQEMPDRRVRMMADEFGLDGRTVLEVGCFEGIHTAALCMMGAHVKAVDARIENIVKTVVRTSMYGFCPQVFPYDLESRNPDVGLLSSDFMHHVGVLYHLKDPVSHVLEIGSYIKEGVMLDTHIATPEQVDGVYEVAGEQYRYMRYREYGRKEVFSGMHDHAKWLLLDDLKKALKIAGFSSIKMVEERDERNGKRVLLFARRGTN